MAYSIHNTSLSSEQNKNGYLVFTSPDLTDNQTFRSYIDSYIESSDGWALLFQPLLRGSQTEYRAHTCQRGKEGSRADCARKFRDYYSHVPPWKGRVTCRLCTNIYGLLFTRARVERKGHVQTVHVYLKIIIHTCQSGKEGSRADCARTCSVIIYTCQRGKEGSHAVQAAFSIFF
jgi:hypothetical protein